MNKISVRFYGDNEVRAVWDDENAKWWFSVLDIIFIEFMMRPIELAGKSND